MFLMTLFQQGATVASGIVRDPVAWASSTISLVTAKMSGGLAAITLPATAEGLAALTLSVLTSIYIASKIFVLWRNVRRADKKTEVKEE